MASLHAMVDAGACAGGLAPAMHRADDARIAKPDPAMRASPAPSSQGDLFGTPPRAEQHRLFFALFPDDAEREALRRLADTLQPVYPRARWARPERYHLTLHFLGESDHLREDQVRAAREALRDFRAGPVEVVLDHLLCLGNPAQPALTMAALHPSQELVAFWRGLQQRLLRAGFKQHAGRSFVPHLTLGYVSPRVQPVDVPAVRLRPGAVQLVHSVQGQPDYDVVGRWPLGE